jgi:hypothetical protein
MTETETVKPEELRKGDRVRVTFEGILNEEWSLAYQDGIVITMLDARNAATIERLPPEGKPLEAGEEVLFQHATFVVRAVIGDRAWIDSKAQQYADRIEHLKYLTRPHGPPISTGRE